MEIIRNKIKSKLYEAVDNKGVLIAVHRGLNGGNVIQNTVLACKNALLHGADIVEIDVSKSKDGVLYAFHDGNELRVLRCEKSIYDLTSKEIDKLQCMNSTNAFDGQYLERVEYILNELKGKCFINVDRAFVKSWEETIDLINKMNMYDQIILKADFDKKYFEVLEEKGSNIMFMPIVRTMEQWREVKKYNLNIVAIEIIFETLESELVSKEFMEELREAKVIPWANAITLGQKWNLSARLGDNGAIVEGPEKHYGKMIDLGFKILQTDWPTLIRDYLKDRNN